MLTELTKLVNKWNTLPDVAVHLITYVVWYATGPLTTVFIK